MTADREAFENRRGFLLSCLALGIAPAVVRADSLMRIVPRRLLIETTRTNIVLNSAPFEDCYWRITAIGLEVRTRRFVTDLANGGWTQGPVVIPLVPFTRGTLDFRTLGKEAMR